MIEQYIDALNNGKIISVDWNAIEEMLGENPKRLHSCSICTNDDCFPPKETYSDTLSEDQLQNVLQHINVQYMAELHKDGLPYQPITVRYFSLVKPLSDGPWVHS